MYEQQTTAVTLWLWS